MNLYKTFPKYPVSKTKDLIKRKMELGKTVFGIVLLCMVSVSLATVLQQTKDKSARNTENEQARDIFKDIFENFNEKTVTGSSQSIIKKVQTFQEVNGAQVTKTVITETFGIPGGRFKRNLRDKIDGVMDKLGNKLDAVKDKAAGVISDATNVGFEAYKNVMDASRY